LCKKPKTTDGQLTPNKSPEVGINTDNNSRSESTNQETVKTNNKSINQDSSGHVTTAGDEVPKTVLTSSGLSINDLARLEVKDKEGRQVLFCDQGMWIGL
jgi:hypothetical protein